MSSKKRGCDYERKLVLMLRSMGYSAVRVAGSGCTSYPSPDIIASNGSRVISFEVKSSQKESLYLNSEVINKLLSFSSDFGSESVIALHLKGKGWFFKDAFKLKDVSPIKLDNSNCSQQF